jgi:hypothetical protein
MRNIFSFVLFSALITSCGEIDKESFLPGYSGPFGEMIVVMDENAWKGRSGDLIMETFANEQYGLPQNEPLFDVIFVPSNKFHKAFKTHRNIVEVIFKTKNDTLVRGVEIFKSKFSKGQLLLRITADDVNDFEKIMLHKRKEMQTLFYNKELNRYIQRNEKHSDPMLKKEIKAKYGVELNFQKDFKIAVADSNFCWLRLERERPQGGHSHQISQGILLYFFPYTKQQDFLDNILFQRKDTIGKYKVSGPSANSYMATDYENMPPQTKELTINNQYAKEVRGLWRMENNFMGGPFYLLVCLDEENNRLIHIESYVFAPHFDKREYLREVEAVARSIKW